MSPQPMIIMAEPSLRLECWPDELSEAQKAAYEKAEKEHLEIKNKLSEIVRECGGKNIYAGSVFTAYQLIGPAPGLEEISKPLSSLKRAPSPPPAKGSSSSTVRANRGKKTDNNYVNDIEEDEDEEEYLPLSKRAKAAAAASSSSKGSKTSSKTPAKVPIKSEKPHTVVSNVRPTESTAIGGLAVGTNDAATKPKPKETIVDLTKDDGPTTTGKVAPDSREVTFSKLQGKTFPSLVVVARPSLRVKENANSDRPQLDGKVKNVLMHTATKFTEWLIQQGLVRSDQGCQLHPGTPLKLGMYSDATKFPYSGGYVWISECCPNRFVSVFSGSLFEGSPHPPSVLLKLIYHWACQTTVHNVVQWVKVDNLYVKGLFTWLRSVCTVALHQHLAILGGPGKKIEVGVISLGTTTQDGQHRQVKVEVLGVLDPEGKIVRLRAVEPLSDGERNYKKRFAKILEPLNSWVHRESIILTDLTVDKGTLHSMGYKTIVQAAPTDTTKVNTNANIMDYLRRIVPRMFQNTLSLLSRQIIQQFLDELVWREWYGTSPHKAFDNIVSHIAEQTRCDGKEPLVGRLNKVAANPFKNWAHLALPPAAASAKRKAGSRKNDPSPPPPVVSTRKNPVEQKSTSKASTSKGNTSKTGAYKASPASVKAAQKAGPASQKGSPASQRAGPASVKNKPNFKIQLGKQPVKPAPAKATPSKTPKIKEKKEKEELIPLEGFFYGIYDGDQWNGSAVATKFDVMCPECPTAFTKNTDLMDHLYKHANAGQNQCRYCVEIFKNKDSLKKHIALLHPTDTKNAITSAFNCIICEHRFATASLLTNHMQRVHGQLELPFKCCGCDYRSSCLHLTIDHFYEKHAESGLLQCPFCLKMYVGSSNDVDIKENIQGFLAHVRRHLNKSVNKRCNRCALSFTHKGLLKAHQLYSHLSHVNIQKKLKPLGSTNTNIVRPKPKVNTQRDLAHFKLIEPYDKIGLILENGTVCAECGCDFEEECHFIGLMKCQKCRYHTACLPTMLDHIATCTVEEFTCFTPLDKEMHCVCGFSSSEGNALARHLANCERRSAYPTVEAAQDNTVKRNMLDMLGLVRREDDNDSTVDETEEGAANKSGQEGDEQMGETAGETSEANAEVGGEYNAGEQSEQQEQTQESALQNNSGDAAVEMETNDQYSTQLSLDDLAPPSVLRPAENQEIDIDRTPIVEEYQSLATPQVMDTQAGEYM